MPRISVSVSDETNKKLEERAKEKGEQTLSQCANELIELGLRVEEAAKKNQDDSEEISLIDELNTIKIMLEKNMAWTIENRAYVRYLLESSPNDTREKNVELANLIREKAKETINNKGYLKETT